MRGASRASLAEASDRLTALATTKAIADTMGDELFAVARLLDSEHALRRTLTDPARPAAAKAGLVRSLLDGKVSAPTLDLLAGMVSARWSASRDLADAAEELAVKALTIAAERARQAGRPGGRAVPVRPGGGRPARAARCALSDPQPARRAQARAARRAAGRQGHPGDGAADHPGGRCTRGDVGWKRAWTPTQAGRRAQAAAGRRWCGWRPRSPSSSRSGWRRRWPPSTDMTYTSTSCWIRRSWAACRSRSVTSSSTRSVASRLAVPAAQAGGLSHDRDRDA